MLEQILELAWDILNSPAGITAMAGILLWILNRIYGSRPAWQQFEGAIISAIKFAEKSIPDNTHNKSAAKLDAALRYVIELYTEARGKPPSKAVTESMAEGIRITHARLESDGNLGTPGG